MHLARPNPVWPHLEAAAEVRLAVTGDYAYIPTYWRARAGGPDEDGVPTSYYAAVQFVCRPSTGNASSATSSSAATGSTPGPQPSSGGAWPRSVTGRPAGTGHDRTGQPAPHGRTITSSGPLVTGISGGPTAASPPAAPARLRARRLPAPPRPVGPGTRRSTAA
jgi:hypothetical protein